MTTHIPIPQARKRLRELAQEHGIEELSLLADAMHRKPPIRRAPTRNQKLTDRQKARIIELAEANPEMPMRAIAQIIGTDQGRVSETLNAAAGR